ncbi:MAG: hypothetical protein P0Y59_21535 [Candidatus Sphingomonas phytovorans]|nr:hypothetical protein [Sphingomonas sp.]WEJ99464.1 MAG: hypothetical protein P0Y59_21535 [Sphingomonas sp.]
MQFSRDGDWYQVIRITGPAHNLLGLKLGEPADAKPVVERMSISNEAPLIEAEDVRTQVLDGILDANAQLGTDYHVAAIRFVTTDTPSPNIYRSLAKIIIEQLAQENTFAAA